ncbi:hypothetical protein [Cysteiniphilum sp. 6C5]|uniref:hypothetical protein n=1 Tax=unclassified Cysteiniphilum TaxID=2610889 RepID=UPI003F86A96E
MKPKFNLEQCDSLKALCEKELGKTHRTPPQKFSLMLPSIEAFLYLVGIIFSIFLFSMALLAIPFFQEINEHIRPTFLITPTIFIGLIAAIIAICTFVLEYTNSDKRNGRALVANSYFYALFITYMTTLFFILLSHLLNNYLFPIFGFIAICLWLIFAFHKTVIFIIFSAKRNQLIDKFYISLFDQAYAEAYIYDEIKNFADQQLISLDLLDYKFFDQNNPNYKYIRANQNGFVLDISLKALIQFAKQLNSPIYLYPTISRKIKMGDALIAIPNTDNLDLVKFNSLINIFTISDHLLFLNEFDQLEVSTIESMKNENKTNIQKTSIYTRN